VGSSSHLTPRWSKGDSNSPSHPERQRYRRAPHGSRAPLPVSESRRRHRDPMPFAAQAHRRPAAVMPPRPKQPCASKGATTSFTAPVYYKFDVRLA
jgi:hypothetical protein